MTWYMVTWMRKDRGEEEYKTGVVLGIFSAPNPEEAMLKAADGILDEEVEKDMSPPAKVRLAEYILNSLESPHKEHEININQLAVDEEGRPVAYKTDDLDLEERE